MAQIEFGGSWYLTVVQAARAWAATALPDASVIGRGENPIEAATELERFCCDELTKVGIDIHPEGTDVLTWRQACRRALADRIVESRR
jgi:hypothetical protein